MHRTIAISLLLAAWLPMDLRAQDDAVLRVQGRGVEGKAPYRGVGVVRFLDASLGAQVVHFDGGDKIPLPLDMNQCYCPQCRTEFANQFDKDLTEATEEEWTQWQRQAIGDIVQRTAAGVRRVRPNAMMSAAVFANMKGGALQGQDPAGWARQGWVDLILPMDYQMQTLQVRVNERQFLKALDDDDRLVSGLSLYMRSGGQVSPRPPALVREQIELIRSLGIHGYCLFAYGHLSDAQAQMLREEVNAEQAVPYFR